MTELSNEVRAYQWALPEVLEVPPDELQLRLDFYHNAVIMYLLDQGVITTRMVSARDVTLALLREMPLDSGLLPEGTLWWAQRRNGVEVALWRPTSVWRVALQVAPLEPPRRMVVPMPGLIFICQPASPPRIYAAKRRPTSPGQAVYHAPVFNAFFDGRTCAGTHKYPENVEEIPESFFTSFFSPGGSLEGGRSKKYPDDLLRLWEELDGKKRYPLGDLVPIGKVEDIMK